MWFNPYCLIFFSRAGNCDLLSCSTPQCKSGLLMSSNTLWTFTTYANIFFTSSIKNIWAFLAIAPFMYIQTPNKHPHWCLNCLLLSHWDQAASDEQWLLFGGSSLVMDLTVIVPMHAQPSFSLDGYLYHWSLTSPIQLCFPHSSVTHNQFWVDVECFLPMQNVLRFLPSVATS